MIVAQVINWGVRSEVPEQDPAVVTTAGKQGAIRTER